jgi:hypothetical protein
MNEANARRLSNPPQAVLIFLLCALCLHAPPARAAAWHGLEPLKSRRADVLRELGRPAQDVPGELTFKVAGGTVTVTFATAKFVATKKLAADYEGTVLLIVLQHTNAHDTPDTLGLKGKDDFEVEEKGVVSVYRNAKDGVAYTFINGHLSTTRYAPAAEQLVRAQVGK